MLSGLCASIQTELDAFFATLGLASEKLRQVSAQAFSKARQGFSAQLFVDANERLLKTAEPHTQRFLWRGLRPVAADGSRMSVATRAGRNLVKDHFAFALFLPGPELTLHASLHAADGCERQMLFEALDLVRPGNDLLLLDRGYPANWLAALLHQRNIDFCMRVDACGWTCVREFLDSGERERRVHLPAPNKRVSQTYEVRRESVEVRLIRDVTPTGTARALMTSLLDADAYPTEHFGALYHRRWRVEEAFKRLKHRLRIEACSGLSFLALQQDFAAKVLTDNLSTLLTDSADAFDECEQTSTTETSETQPKGRKGKPNRTYALGALKPILAGCVLGISTCRHALGPILDAILTTRCRPSTTQSDQPRKSRTKPHLSASYRPVR